MRLWNLQTLPRPTLIEMQESKNSMGLSHCSLSGSSPSPSIEENQDCQSKNCHDNVCHGDDCNDDDVMLKTGMMRFGNND